jgi:hypothetical protein
MIPAEFAPKKVKRKLQSSGLLDVIVSATELLIRKRLGRKIFTPLVERNVIQTIPRQELIHQAINLTTITDNTSTGTTLFTSQIQNGYVLPETGLATTSGFKIIEESAATPANAQQAMINMCSRELFFGYLPIWALLSNRCQIKTSVLNAVAPLIPRYQTNYYHWMAETVPKVRYLREFERQTGTEITVLINSGAPPFVEETLKLLNWPDSRIKRATESIYEVQNLIIPATPAQSRNDYNWLRNQMLDSVSAGIKESNQTRNNRIYISRKNAIERRVVNENEVLNMLEQYGFERHFLENKSLKENIRLFRDADIIVGPHGAGLTDIIFSKECALVELFGIKLNRSYENLASTLGIDYRPVYCQADSADIIVDIKELKTMIATLIE